MPSSVFIITLLAALLHASWNALLKKSSHKLMTSIIVSAFGSLLSIIVLPFLKFPDPSSYLYISISILLQITYMLLLSQAYQIADMTQTYPLMRGGAPVFVALINLLLLNEKISIFEWQGVLVLCIGIVSLSFTSKKLDKNGILLSLGNAFVISCYSIIDGIGARLSHSPIAYTLCVLFMQGIFLLAFGMINYKKDLIVYLSAHWHLGLMGGFGAIFSYALALWAMTKAPILLVAGLRETSILFGLIIAHFLLGEKISLRGILSSVIIVIGIILYKI